MEAQGSDPVLEAIRALSPRGKKPRHEVQKALDSFTAQAVRMDYPTYVSITGADIVKSTCRLVSNLRTKEPGMRSSEAGVQAILSLRALVLSHGKWWKEFFRPKPQRCRPPVATLTRSMSAIPDLAIQSLHPSLKSVARPRLALEI